MTPDACLLELVEPDLLQHASFLGLDLVAGDAAVGHEPLRRVTHRPISLPYRSYNKAALIVKAWNLYRTGGTCETLQWSPSGKFPKPV